MLRSMHGMLSSAVVLAAFAVIAGAGGYTALWLYRASSGGQATSPASSTLRALGRSARSWLIPEAARSGPAPAGPAPAGPDGESTAAPPAASTSMTAVPGKIVSRDVPPGGSRARVTFIEGDEPDPADELGEIEAVGFSDATISGPAIVSGAESGTGEAGDPDESPGAKVYVLGQSRRPRLP